MNFLWANRSDSSKWRKWRRQLNPMDRTDSKDAAWRFFVSIVDVASKRNDKFTVGRRRSDSNEFGRSKLIRVLRFASFWLTLEGESSDDRTKRNKFVVIEEFPRLQSIGKICPQSKIFKGEKFFSVIPSEVNKSDKRRIDRLSFCFKSMIWTLKFLFFFFFFCSSRVERENRLAVFLLGQIRWRRILLQSSWRKSIVFLFLCASAQQRQNWER